MRKSFGVLPLLVACMLMGKDVSAQQNEGVHEMSKDYQAPKDPLVIRKLSKWQDQRFGLFMHWGTYTLWEEVESWSICPVDWVVRKGPYSEDYNVYRAAYENLQHDFNPVDFNPEKWEKAAKAAGMKYVVFTTKHHDGFCMFDTKETDYKITSTNTPFSKNPRSNVTKEIFDAFRKDSFMIGAYFSKPDWHSQDYWWKYYPPADEHANYDVKKFPERWKRFNDYTYRQIEELMTGYGPIDILWLDGGWVRTNSKRNEILDMKGIVNMARTHQPGLIVVDRTVPGEFENYTTPEQSIPDKPLPYPWETCMTMGNSWTHTSRDEFKSSRTLVETLIKIVSRGGNLLLGVGPSAKGDWAPDVYKRMEDMGKWMDINGEGIHGSRPVAPYSEKNIYFTQSKDQHSLYAFYTSETDEVKLPAEVTFSVQDVKKVNKVTLLGSKAKLQWTLKDGQLTIRVPKNIQEKNGLKYSAAFKINV
ncbi:alpha-L-fucosidase [Chitinophaga rhizophila]|uniref:alpha-L-fucosidase n=1 Tax=Chitinophaga rhizophila TaxID=2866212 RepID=A0ABS7GKQ2_9BACT|nr:alpha-L-fucosidase [Chitinophaga rhizophila]MBW8687765.1 alpha-L-fucosidase [Chitinophaga rhizophila]